MKRKMIKIDTEQCDGCGRCIPNCPEGALQIIDGKARLVSELFCDGLGACLGECPRHAISIEEREAEPYSESKVMENIAAQGKNTVRVHLQHLKSHGANELYREAVAYLEAHHMPVPELAAASGAACHCPGSMARRMTPEAHDETGSTASELSQWPIQLKLLNPDSEFFDDADLLVAADCTAFACGGFHRDFLRGRILIVFCPKLDSDLEQYVEKLTAIFRKHSVRSVRVVRMEVPCCGGTTAIVEKALRAAGSNLRLSTTVVGIDGSIQN